jgi:uncharacterized membrane protein YeaQ/YmgE (transglycosylase-associated protein family)
MDMHITGIMFAIIVGLIIGALGRLVVPGGSRSSFGSPL